MMQTGVQRLQFMSCAGAINFCSMSEFLDGIVKHFVGDKSRAEVSVSNESLSAGNYYAKVIPTESTYSRKEVILKEMGYISHSEILSRPTVSEQDLLSQVLPQICHNFMTTRIKTIIAQKEAEKEIVPELTIKSVEEMSVRYVDNMGGFSNINGIVYHMGKYQKFFIIASPEVFKLFVGNFYKDPRNPLERKVPGELVDMYPNKWVMLRFTENKLYGEMEGMRFK